MKIKFKISWLIYFFIILLMGLTAWLFLTPSLTDACSDELIACMEPMVKEGFWVKMCTGFGCVGKNVVCVFGQLGTLF